MKSCQRIEVVEVSNENPHFLLLRLPPIDQPSGLQNNADDLSFPTGFRRMPRNHLDHLVRSVHKDPR